MSTSLHESRWYAFRTKARAEKRVVGLLESAGFEADAAIAEVERKWSDRTKRVAMPLFAGYLFARLPLERLTKVLATPGVVTVLRTDGVPTPIREEEMESVRCLVRGTTETGALPAPEDYLEPGEPVQVVDGPYRGLQGVLLENRGRERVAVRLRALRQAVAVQLRREWLRPADRN